jgi:stage V sporulation protein D (sporulation-specific penicillin-binding protein)
MLMAENAVINGGTLYQPLLVKSEIDTATGDIVKENRPTSVRNVISAQVSKTMVSMLTESGDRTVGLNDYKEFKIGGKTGTAQKIIDGRYVPGKNVANFYGFAPYDNPVVSVLIIVDEPSGGLTTGSVVAGPVAGKIISQSLGRLRAGDKAVGSQAKSAFIVPDMRGQTIDEATAIMQSFGADYVFSGDHDGIVTGQSIMREEYVPGTKIILFVTSMDTDMVLMPDLKGMTVQQANNVLSSLGISLRASGGGIAVSQSVEKDTFVKKSSEIEVVFKYIE